MGDFETNRLLQRISNELRSIDLQNLKHLCHGSIPLRELEKAQYGFELFRVMLQKRLIKPSNLSFLGELLSNIGRSDLANRIQTSGQDDITMQTESGLERPSMASPLERDLRKFLMQLSDELTQDNVESLKFVSDLPVGIEEKIQTGRDLFKFLIQSGTLRPNQLGTLMDMFGEIHRRDLAEKVKKFQTSGQGGISEVNPPVLPCTNRSTLQPTGTIKEPTMHHMREPRSVTIPLMSPAAFKPRTRAGENVEPRYPVQAVASTAELLDPMEQLGVDEEEAMPSYPMNKRPRGVALIVSNEHFDENPTLRDRRGNAKDVESLEELWRFLNFEVIVKEDLTSYDVYNVMREFSAMDHSNFDCFVCCLLSHGADGGIYGTDCELVEIRDITAQFKGTACKSLAHKPKLFFVQACRGQNFDRGVEIESDAVEGDADDAMRHSAEPSESHFLLGYATPPGYVSWRSQIHGSWYISKLCEVFRKYCQRFDLMTMMVKVNDEVSEAYTRLGYKQCPAPVVTLRKRLYLNDN